nr:reverse transcriptase domain-containing protein [Tanacetum cinerariifolium]
MKLNPKKGAFGMREGTFLGYKVNADGSKVCPDKVEAVLNLPSSKCLKDVQRLNRKLESLNRFFSKSAEKSLPFFKTLKKYTKKSDFQWTREAEITFRQMKKLIAELPMLTAPKEKEELIIYLAATKEAIIAILMTKRDRKQMPVYFISRALQDDSGAGLILTNPEGMEFTYALRFRFEATNNEAEYEALIAGLRIAEQTGVKNLQSRVDSQLVANQVNGSYVVKEPGVKNLQSRVDSQLVANQVNGSYVVKEPGMIHSLTPITDLTCNKETPFSLTYGTEAVIPVEIGMPTWRTVKVDMIKNDEALGINLDLLEEKREQAAIQEAKSKAKMEKYYNARVRNTIYKQAISSTKAMRQAVRKMEGSLDLSGKDRMRSQKH